TEKAQASLCPEAVNARLTDEALEQLWVQCYSCQTNLPRKELAENLHVCSHCGYHFRIDSRIRLAQIADTFEEINTELQPADPLGVVDSKPYVKRIDKAIHKSSLNEAIVTGLATIGSVRAAVGVMDFDFMGGTMGSV